MAGDIYLCGQTQHLLYQLLSLGGFLQEELHDGRQQLQLDLNGAGKPDQRLKEGKLVCFLLKPQTKPQEEVLKGGGS